MYALTAAHPTLQLPSVVEVVNLENGRSLTLRVNDRGPFVDDRLIDLSLAAARELGFERQGLAQVQVRYLGLARLDDAPIRPGEGRRRRDELPAAGTRAAGVPTASGRGQAINCPAKRSAIAAAPGLLGCLPLLWSIR